MSAFMCSEETINRIVTGLNYHFCTVDRGIKRMLLNNNYDLAKEKIDAKLHYDLIDLNERSLLERYNETALDMFPLTRYKLANVPTTDIQLIKSLECYLYQSCEGNCDKDTLFRMLTEILINLSRNFVHKQQAYEDADWG